MLTTQTKSTSHRGVCRYDGHCNRSGCYYIHHRQNGPIARHIPASTIDGQPSTIGKRMPHRPKQVSFSDLDNKSSKLVISTPVDEMKKVERAVLPTTVTVTLMKDAIPSTHTHTHAPTSGSIDLSNVVAVAKTVASCQNRSSSRNCVLLARLKHRVAQLTSTSRSNSSLSSSTTPSSTTATSRTLFKRRNGSVKLMIRMVRNGDNQKHHSRPHHRRSLRYSRVNRSWRRVPNKVPSSVVIEELPDDIKLNKPTPAITDCTTTAVAVTPAKNISSSQQLARNDRRSAALTRMAEDRQMAQMLKRMSSLAI